MTSFDASPTNSPVRVAATHGRPFFCKYFTHLRDCLLDGVTSRTPESVLEARPAVRAEHEDRLGGRKGILGANSCGCRGGARQRSSGELQSARVLQRKRQNEQ